MRHIQFKTGKSSKPGDIAISVALAAKPSGCVLWIRVTDDLEMGPYFWFGGRPGQALPLLDTYASPKRATNNKGGERPLRKNHRLIPSRDFKQLDGLDQVLTALFDEAPPA